MAFALRAVTSSIYKLACGASAETDDHDFSIIEKPQAVPKIVADEVEFKPAVHSVKPLPHVAMDLSAGVTDDEITDLSKGITNANRPALLRFCTGNLVARLDIEGNIESTRVWYDIYKGFTTLANCHDEWHERYKEMKGLQSLDEILTRITDTIEQLPVGWQLGFWRALESLHGTFDWVSHEEEAVATEDYEISGTIWFLEMGLLEIALGWVQGRSTAELALAAEQAWSDKADSLGENKTALEDFAVYMRECGRNALTKFGGENGD